jgi:hypothetical protein
MPAPVDAKAVSVFAPPWITFIVTTDDEQPDGSEPIKRGRVKPGPSWRDPGPRERYDQRGGGHTRKIDSFSGHAGHSGGAPDLREHQRNEPDWDAEIEAEIEDPTEDPEASIEDEVERAPGTLTYIAQPTV